MINIHGSPMIERSHLSIIREVGVTSENGI